MQTDMCDSLFTFANKCMSDACFFQCVLFASLIEMDTIDVKHYMIQPILLDLL